MSWFIPPVFEDEIKTQQAYLLHVILWTLICVPIIYLIFVFIEGTDDPNRALAQAAFGEITNVILLIMLRRGYVRMASILQVSAFWGFFTATAATGNGVRGEAYLLGYSLVIAIAGMLLGATGASIFTVLSLVAGGLLVFGQTAGLLVSNFEGSLLATWTISLLLFPVGAVLQHLGSRIIRSSLTRARASEARYLLISQVSSNYTFSTELDLQGNMRLNWVAGALEKITGYTFDDYVATGGWLAHLHPEDAEKDARALEILKTNQRVVHDIRTYTKDRSVKWVRVYAHPVWDETKNCLTGIVGAVQDITEQKQTEIALMQERDLLQLLMDNIPDTVYLKDLESRFVRVNQTQARLLGLNDPKNAIGKTDLDFQLSDRAQQFMEEEKRILATGQPVVNRIEMNPTNDGEPRWLSTTKVPVNDSAGHIIGIIGISRDVTEQILSEQYEQRRRDMLEKIIKLGQYLTEVQDIRSTLQRIWYSVRYDLNFDRLGIYLYNSQQNVMDGTYGTDDQGEIVDEWFRHISLENATVETNSFLQALQKPNGLYLTRNYEMEHKIPNGDMMTGVKDFAAVAAWAGDKPVAVLCVDSLITQRPITDEQLEALRLFAGYAGLAIENARLNDALQYELMQQMQAKEQASQRRSILEKVVVLGQQVTEVSNLRTTLEKIWHGVHDALEFDRLGIFLYNPERNSMDGTLGTSRNGQLIEEWDHWFPLSEVGLFRRAIEKPDSIYFTHNYNVENEFEEGHEMYGVKDFAAVAAWAGGKPVAVICVDRAITQENITEEQLEALRLFSGYAGLAIENARLNDKLQNELVVQKLAEERESQRRAILEQVIILGQQVTEVSTLNTTLEKIWHGVHDTLRFDRLGIFLYNPARNTMDGSLGTNKFGQMTDESDKTYPVNEGEIATNDFKRVLGIPDGVYVTRNYDAEHNIPPGDVMDEVKDFVCVAAWAGNKPVAVICADHLITRRPITDEQVEALRLFAGYAALAIENARLNDALESELLQEKQAEALEARRRAILEIVVRLGKHVTKVSDLKTTLERIWHGIHDDLQFDRLAIFLYDQPSHSVKGTLGTSNHGEIVEEWDYARSLDQEKPTSFTRALEQPDGVYLTRNFDVEYNVPEDHEMYGVKDFAAVTAWGGDSPVAIITVDNFPSKRPFSEEQLEALRLFSGYAGLAIQNARLNTALENDLKHRKVLIEELETKNAELERFTYTVSHDLKSPLVTITGFLGYLEKDAMAGEPAKIKSTINRINNAAYKMQALLNDLLELSRVGRIMNAPENIPFHEIVNEAVDRVRGKLDEINAVIEIQRDMPFVYGDRVRLVEVVQNLVENAAKYSIPKARPRIEIGAKTELEKSVVLFVHDNGIGIAPEYHENIFGLFNKLDPTADGTGIGLTLVKRIIEVHGGRIWVESEAGQGATFYFTLPKIPQKE